MTTEAVNQFSGSPESLDSHWDMADLQVNSVSFLLSVIEAMASIHDLEDLLQHVVKTMRCALNGFWTGIFIFEPRNHSFRLRAANGVLNNKILNKKLTASFEINSTPFTEAVIRHRTPLTYTAKDNLPFLDSLSCADMEISKALVLPILSSEQVLGFGLVLNEDDNPEYPTEEIHIFSLVVGALASTIEFDRLNTEFKRTHTERRTLQEVTSAVLGESDLRKAMELACLGAQQITGAGGSAIMLLDEEDTLRVVYSMGDAAEWSDILLPENLIATPSNIPIEPLLLDNLGDEYAVTEGQLVKSLVVVPLAIHGEGIGILQLINLENRIQEDQLRAISLFADRVALSIEHVKLHLKHERAAVIEERHRLARDLHDSVTQSVYGVTVYAEAAARLLEINKVDQAVKSLRELRDVSVRALHEMRALIFELHPPEIAQMGLIAALETRLAAVESRSNLKTQLHARGIECLPREIEEGLYRMAQEALNNCTKHSGATRVILWLNQTDDSICLEIEDDGVGFNVQRQWCEGGLGIRSMQERASALGGSIKIDSQPGKGTIVVVKVPLITKDEA